MRQVLVHLAVHRLFHARKIARCAGLGALRAPIGLVLGQFADGLARTLHAVVQLVADDHGLGLVGGPVAGGFEVAVDLAVGVDQGHAIIGELVEDDPNALGVKPALGEPFQRGDRVALLLFLGHHGHDDQIDLVNGAFEFLHFRHEPGDVGRAHIENHVAFGHHQLTEYFSKAGGLDFLDFDALNRIGVGGIDRLDRNDFGARPHCCEKMNGQCALADVTGQIDECNVHGLFLRLISLLKSWRLTARARRNSSDAEVKPGFAVASDSDIFNSTGLFSSFPKISGDRPPGAGCETGGLAARRA